MYVATARNGCVLVLFFFHEIIVLYLMKVHKEALKDAALNMY
jgi:hypothetical protein